MPLKLWPTQLILRLKKWNPVSLRSHRQSSVPWCQIALGNPLRWQQLHWDQPHLGVGVRVGVRHCRPPPCPGGHRGTGLESRGRAVAARWGKGTGEGRFHSTAVGLQGQQEKRRTLEMLLFSLKTTGSPGSWAAGASVACFFHVQMLFLLVKFFSRKQLQFEDFPALCFFLSLRKVSHGCRSSSLHQIPCPKSNTSS